MCAICGRHAVMLFGGFNFCGTHARLARRERQRWQQVTFADLEHIHDEAPKDADGDAVHDKDPIVRRWVLVSVRAG